MAAKKKRKLSAKQLAALAKGRKAAAAKRKGKKRTAASKKRPVAKKRSMTTRKRVTRTAPKRKGVKSMARKRRRAPEAAKKPRRRRSSGGGRFKLSGVMDMVKEAGVAIGGGVAAGILSNKLPIANTQIKALAPAAAGILLASTIGKRNRLVRQVAFGMVTLSGVAFVRQQFPQVPLLAGEEELYYLPEMTGENVQLGQPYDDEFDDMGGVVSLGQDEMPYLSPASI